MLKSLPHESVHSSHNSGKSRFVVPTLGCFVAQVRGDLRERGLAVFGRCAEDRTCAERNDAALVFLALGDALYTSRDGAFLERVLVDHDDLVSLVISHKKFFVMEGLVPVLFRSLPGNGRGEGRHCLSR